jgi:hypothetical protein
MAERRKRFIRWLLPKLIVFAIGVAVGYYARDRQQTDFKDLYEQTLAELEDLKETGEDMIERGRRAGDAMKAAADSTRAAVEEVKGGN